MAKGVQANWIHRGEKRPANPVRRHPAKSVCTRVRMIMTLDMDVTAERRHYNTHCPLKGKRLTTFCASLRSGGRRLAVRKMIECHIPAQTRTPFPASRDFPSRGNEGHGEKNRRVIYFMYHSGVSPFGGWRHHLSAPLGSVSLDSQSPTAPCESSSLATASGGTIKFREAMYS